MSKKNQNFDINIELMFKNQPSVKNTIINTYNTLPWIEKYKPKLLNDLLIDDNIMIKLKNIINCNAIPNLLIYGPAGSGKTIMLQLFIKELLSHNKFTDNYKESILELDASDNRGLDIINNTIIYFCKKKILLDHKIIILDEADNITKKAQNLLNNLIEEFSETTKFCLICNDSCKIIESIQSRCLILRLKGISDDNIYKKLEEICKYEKITYNEIGLKTIVDISQGDIRYAINNLEAIYYSFGEITKNNIYKLCYQPNPDQIINIIKLTLKKDLPKILIELTELKHLGYCNFDIIQTLLLLLKTIKIDENIRIIFVRLLSDCYIKINEGNDSNLQLYSCFSKVIQILRTF